jgi:hypothetical protein
MVEAIIGTSRCGPVDFGQPITDTATLTNTANHQGSGGVGTDGSINPTTPGGPADGTITFTLLKADCTTLATGTGTNPQTVVVNGDGTYGPVSFTVDTPGPYHWQAVYSGDAPNTLGSSHNVTCDDPIETVIIRLIPTNERRASAVDSAGSARSAPQAAVPPHSRGRPRHAGSALGSRQSTAPTRSRAVSSPVRRILLLAGAT